MDHLHRITFEKRKAHCRVVNLRRAAFQQTMDRKKATINNRDARREELKPIIRIGRSRLSSERVDSLTSLQPTVNKRNRETTVERSKRKPKVLIGPLQETVEDFWHMIFQEKSNVIVMLCNFNEGKHEKCRQYYPKIKNGVEQYGAYRITIKDTKPDFMDTVKYQILEAEYSTYFFIYVYWNFLPIKYFRKTSSLGKVAAAESKAEKTDKET
uniref:protein-tyrosine-phosphatase n=1 Tax=Heterorhabditis bacteriophora TaxID=37862 RepID=A0A1I7WS75_HETBA